MKEYNELRSIMYSPQSNIPHAQVKVRCSDHVPFYNHIEWHRALQKHPLAGTQKHPPDFMVTDAPC